MSGSGSAIIAQAIAYLSEQSVVGKGIWMLIGGLLTKGVEWLWGIHGRSKDRAVDKALTKQQFDQHEKRLDKIEEKLSTDRATPISEDATNAVTQKPKSQSKKNKHH